MIPLFSINLKHLLSIDFIEDFYEFFIQFFHLGTPKCIFQIRFGEAFHCCKPV